MGPASPSTILPQESSCLRIQFNLPSIKKIFMGDTTPLINAVWSKLKHSMAPRMCYNKEIYSLHSSYLSRNVLIFFALG